MKKSRLLTQTVMTTVMGMASAGWLAAQAQTTTPGMPPRPGQSRSIPGTDSTTSGQVQKVNKCSDLIGMEVKNQQGEKLGKIQDVVIDFAGDRVGYVVLNADEGALATGKLHAVPLRAFQPSVDGKELILNADKEKLANAQALTKDNWPSPSNPSWGAEPFWQEQGSQRLPDSTSPATPNRSTPGSTPGTMPDRNNTTR
jgi:sporulation protein YlmC with PRC-barrel domain